MNKLSLFNKIVFSLNVVAAIALLISYLGWFINPNTLPLLGIISLGVPVLLGINAVFVIYWLLLRKKQLFLSVVCLIFGWSHIQSLYQLPGKKAETATTNSLRVMTYNVHYYSPDHRQKGYVSKKKMVHMMEKENPDIFCAQEFQRVTSWVPRKRMKYKFISKESKSQLAIYSAYKIINKGEINHTDDKNNYSKFIFADVLFNNDTLRIVNVHLKSIGLYNEDLKTFADVENLSHDDKVKSSGKTIVKSMLSAFEVRGHQVDGLAEFIKKSPHKIILCGDFNDTPTSYTYRQLTQNLADSYVSAGSGLVATHPKFHARKIPMRIDYILADSTLQTTGWKLVKARYSDHFPVVVDYSVYGDTLKML